MGTKKEYSKEDIQFLIENYSKHGAKYCADKLNRTTKSTSQKAFNLGLKVDKAVLQNNIMKNVSGKRFGKLIVLNEPPTKKGNGELCWKCLCDCGNNCIVNDCGLRSGRTKSCGCSAGNHKHGLGRNGIFATNYKMWRIAKRRAKDTGILFTISPADIVIPDRCPLLDIPICTSNHNTCDNSPSLDRIDNSKGYSSENIWVISYKANRTKSNLSISELKMLVENLEQKIVEQKIHENRKS